ncbi:hypothetical protein KIPB_009104, partial [Kipferlia bialata]
TLVAYPVSMYDDTASRSAAISSDIVASVLDLPLATLVSLSLCIVLVLFDGALSLWGMGRSALQSAVLHSISPVLLLLVAMGHTVSESDLATYPVTLYTLIFLAVLVVYRLGSGMAGDRTARQCRAKGQETLKRRLSGDVELESQREAEQEIDGSPSKLARRFVQSHSETINKAMGPASPVPSASLSLQRVNSGLIMRPVEMQSGMPLDSYTLEPVIRSMLDAMHNRYRQEVKVQMQEEMAGQWVAAQPVSDLEAGGAAPLTRVNSMQMDVYNTHHTLSRIDPFAAIKECLSASAPVSHPVSSVPMTHISLEGEGEGESHGDGDMFTVDIEGLEGERPVETEEEETQSTEGEREREDALILEAEPEPDTLDVTPSTPVSPAPALSIAPSPVLVSTTTASDQALSSPLIEVIRMSPKSETPRQTFPDTLDTERETHTAREEEETSETLEEQVSLPASLAVSGVRPIVSPVRKCKIHE